MRCVGDQAKNKFNQSQMLYNLCKKNIKHIVEFCVSHVWLNTTCIFFTFQLALNNYVK